MSCCGFVVVLVVLWRCCCCYVVVSLPFLLLILLRCWDATLSCFCVAGLCCFDVVFCRVVTLLRCVVRCRKRLKKKRRGKT